MVYYNQRQNSRGFPPFIFILNVLIQNDFGGRLMSVNLQKGQKVDLTKGNTGLKTILVGLGWDEVTKLFKERPAKKSQPLK